MNEPTALRADIARLQQRNAAQLGPLVQQLSRVGLHAATVFKPGALAFAACMRTREEFERRQAAGAQGRDRVQAPARGVQS